MLALPARQYMNVEPTTTTQRRAPAESFLFRMEPYLTARFSAPGSISLAVTAMRRTRRHRS